MLKDSFIFCAPERQTSRVVFGSPHSGRVYPESFLENSLLDSTQIRSSEDAFVDQLFSCAPEFGSPILSAVAPRAYVDLNRRSDELDGSIVQGASKSISNPRIASGLGVIPRVVSDSRVIQSGKITLEQAHARLDEFYHPYHKKLRQVLDATRETMGGSILIDCHSMPHAATDKMVVKGGGRPDVVLGDRFGASSTRFVADAIEQAFVDHGFSVSRNVPFAGAFIVQEYGRPSRGQHAIQIELDRALYMDEEQIVKNSSYWDTQERLRSVIESLVRIGQQELPIAAE